MKVQCCDCSKVYLVPDDKIGKSGRKVKCTSCGYTWYVLPVVQKEKRRWWLQSIAYSSLTLLATIALCVILVGDVFPNEIGRMYKMIHSYRSPVSHKSDNKLDEQIDAKAVDFYQDYLLLSHLKLS